MSDRFAACLAAVLREEGAYVNDPADPGGCTNRGITRATLEAWRGRPTNCADVAELGVEEAGAIYRKGYWVEGLPPGVDLALFDAAVNSGAHRAAVWLQQAAGCNAIDGAIGPATRAAVAGEAASVLVMDMCRRRLAFLAALPTYPTFGKGWSARVQRVRDAALAAANMAPAIG